VSLVSRINPVCADNVPYRFECLDCAIAQAVRADVVLCLEVLIHQHRREQFDGLVKNIVAAAVKGGLVSGYMFDPRPAVSSDIIACMSRLPTLSCTTAPRL
jgi:hypothetical protein